MMNKEEAQYYIDLAKDYIERFYKPVQSVGDANEMKRTADLLSEVQENVSSEIKSEHIYSALVELNYVLHNFDGTKRWLIKNS